MTSETTDKRAKTRRELLISAGILAGTAIGWQLWIRRPRNMEFEPINALPGWRQVNFEGVSTAGAGLSGIAFLGIGAERQEVPPLAPERICDTLYTSQKPGVPIAVFSDFFCPFCRELIPLLASMDKEQPGQLSITWHELPLLGPTSESAARAASAADLQGGYEALQRYLFSNPFRPTTRFYADASIAAGLSPGQLLADMDGSIVRSRLRQSRGAARTLGIYGTPAMTIGKTLVMGAVSRREIEKLIEMEATATC